MNRRNCNLLAFVPLMLIAGAISGHASVSQAAAAESLPIDGDSKYEDFINTATKGNWHKFGASDCHVTLSADGAAAANAKPSTETCGTVYVADNAVAPTADIVFLATQTTFDFSVDRMQNLMTLSEGKTGVKAAHATSRAYQATVSWGTAGTCTITQNPHSITCMTGNGKTGLTATATLN